MAANPVNVHVLSHPLVNTRLAKLRQVSTTSKEFREGIHELSIMVGYEASRDLEEISVQGAWIHAHITRGLGMTDGLLTLFPDAPVYHLGIYREKVSLQPVEYYSKLPPSPPIDLVFLLDPLIATGGTATAALHMITDWGIPLNKIKLLCILASEEGLKNLSRQFPGLEVWAAAVDPHLTKDGLISPGLGDTGDRLNNTARES
ncbi:UDP-N-acetylglucosamine 1-carboxyvinyltransferase [Russula aff. rugulosa BPL654]|nr:UDP-N-acetylglucosamine 1-carboxyvinyltransferase [Russula aff. rugulosa BPL654]